MLGKLKIKCDIKQNGCKEVLLLENLSQHTVECLYNVEMCKKCLCEIQDKSVHDCIKTLLELNRKANVKIATLEHNSSAKMVSTAYHQIFWKILHNIFDKLYINCSLKISINDNYYLFIGS
jgi:hypothetical protein